MSRGPSRIGVWLLLAAPSLAALGCSSQVETHEAGKGAGGSATSSSQTSSAATTASGLVCSAECDADHDITCCGTPDTCVSLFSDIKNCGGCGVVCPAEAPYCDFGDCVPRPCSPDAGACADPGVCCGDECCAPGTICCEVPDAYGPKPSCVKETDYGGTCPPLCPSCNG